LRVVDVFSGIVIPAEMQISLFFTGTHQYLWHLWCTAQADGLLVDLWQWMLNTLELE